MADSLSKRLLPIAFLLVLMVFCPAPASAGETAVFPETGLEGAVGFWQDVFIKYGKNHLLIHDANRVDLVWEVLSVEGDYETDAAAAAWQKRQVQAARARWEESLETLAGKMRAGVVPGEGEKAILQTAAAALGRAPSAAELEAFAQNLHVQRGVSERFRRGWIEAGRYLPLMAEIFEEENVPTELLALPLFESSFQLSSRSHAGAVGVWQFIRSTGKMYLKHVNKQLDYRLDPLISTRGAARYLLDARNRLGSWPLAVMSYNHGVGGLARARNEHGSDPARIIEAYSSPIFGFASRNYYPEFLAALRILRNPSDFFSEGTHPREPWLFDEDVLDKPESLGSVARRHGLGIPELRSYNPAILSAKQNLMLPAGYPLRLPPDFQAGKMASRTPEKGKPAAVGAPARAVAVAAASPAGAPSTRAALSAETTRPAPASAERAAKAAPKAGGKGSGRGVHVVQPGETVYRIAVRYGIKPEMLRNMNRMRNNVIYPGQRLQVPLREASEAEGDLR